MNCNPDINRAECWVCQRNPYVHRVPLTLAGGILSPGGPGAPAGPGNPISAVEPEDNKEPKKGVHINVYLF